MIDRDHTLSVTRQAALRGINRGTVYLPAQARLRCRPGADAPDRRTVPAASLQGRADAASSAVSRQLRQEGVKVGRRHVATLMKKMGIEDLAPQPGTRQRAPEHKIYPYLLHNVAITTLSAL